METKSPFTKHQRVLMTLLRDLGVPRHAQLGIILVLGEDEEVLDDWCLWIADNHPTERMIMDKLLEKE